MRQSPFGLAFAPPFALLSALTVLTAAEAPARAQVTVAVDPSADAHAISPLIYGMNFPSDPQIAGARLTVGRWGGNSTTRYNYQTDVHNTAFDYFYENLPGCWGSDQNYCATPPSDPQEQSSANAFLTGLAAKNVVALFTIPTIGWVPKPPARYSHPFDCGCRGAGQDSYDPYDAACGNGQIGGNDIDCGPASSTSVASDPTWAGAWVTYLVSKFGPAAGKRIYALDNEPALWSSTHHDVRKTRLGYDELWQRMRDTAVAILEADPTAEISGPVEWGWPNYFCSDLDVVSEGCFPTSPDRAAHGGEELVAWLLDQAKAYEQQNGKRILHYLDLHYYPQGGNPPDITRSLWDPTYTDPSWINDKIYLLPRMRAWVDQHYPGTKIAVSEYDFYSHDQPIGAVTYAEVLGIFGREGLDVGTAWSPPDPTQAAFAAYALFRDYDGNGAGFEATSVRATVTGNGVQAYAATGPTRLTVVLVNETAAGVNADLTVGDFVAGTTAKVFSHAGSGGAITPQPDVAVQNGALSLALPGTSITLVAIDGTNPNEPPDAGTGSASSASSGGAATAGSGGSAATGSGGAAATTTGGSGGAAGTGSGGPAAGSGGGGTGGGSGSKGGCGCRAEPREGTGALPVIAGAALALSVARRRRRPR